MKQVFFGLVAALALSTAVQAQCHSGGYGYRPAPRYSGYVRPVTYGYQNCQPAYRPSYNGFNQVPTSGFAPGVLPGNVGPIGNRPLSGPAVAGPNGPAVPGPNGPAGPGPGINGPVGNGQVALTQPNGPGAPIQPNGLVNPGGPIGPTVPGQGVPGPGNPGPNGVGEVALTQPNGPAIATPPAGPVGPVQNGQSPTGPASITPVSNSGPGQGVPGTGNNPNLPARQMGVLANE